MTGIVPALVPLDRFLPPGNVWHIRIHVTWGGGNPSPEDFERYDLLCDRVGHFHRGVRHLNHTFEFGFCGMAGASLEPFSPGKYPLTIAQWESGIRGIADICSRYDLPATRTVLFTHAEEPELLYGTPAEPWELVRLPFSRGEWEGRPPAEEIRLRVRELLKERKQREIGLGESP